MPTVDSIARQRDLTADVSSKFFGTDFQAAKNSMLIKGPMETAADMVSSNFGLRSNISEMLGTYAEEKEAFNEQFDKTLASLKESADKLKESVKAEADNNAAISKQLRENEQARREVAKSFADDAIRDIQRNAQTRQRDAERLNDARLERIKQEIENPQGSPQQAIAAREQAQAIAQAHNDNLPQRVGSREQIQSTIQAQQENVEQLDSTREQARERVQLRRNSAELLADLHRRNQSRVQTQRENTETFARQYLVAENNQNLNVTRNDDTGSALSNVRNLVDRFNDTVSYFNENRSVSDRMSALASSFNDTENLAGSLNSVGITLNEGGTLTINESRLSDALNQNSSGVNELLGRLDRTVELANSQRDNLFPSVTDYVSNRRDEPTESLYAAQLNQTAALARESGANFINMFT